MGTLYDDAVAGARRRFVGRRAEIERFRALLATGEGRVWWLFGPGGIGKSRLLLVLAEEAAAAGLGVIDLDLRSGDASPSELVAGLTGGPGGGDAPRRVLICDNVDQAPTAERLLREQVLTSLPSGSVVVLGSRQPPGPGWRSDPAWPALLDQIPLRGLDPADGRRLLIALGVTDDLVPPALSLARGHPLALQLLAATLVGGDRRVPPDLDRAPDLVAALLARLVDEVPDDDHRRAVEIAALARVTSRSMLRHLCGPDRADELFDWLAARPWIDRAPGGLCPHDLARDVIEADLRGNDPDRHAAARRAVRGHVLDPDRIREQPDRSAVDYIHLQRGSSRLRSAWHWDSLGNVETGPVLPGDRDVLAGLVERDHGPAVVPVLDHWLARQPRAFTVVRSLDRILGFSTLLVIDEPGTDDLAADPSLDAIWRRVLRRGRTRPDGGEVVGVFRFTCDVDAGPYPPSPTYNVSTVTGVRHWFTCPGLGLDFIVKPAGASYRPMMDYIGFHQAEDATHRIDGVEMAVFEHDWRETPPARWLDRMEALEAGAPVLPAADTAPVLVALDEAAFATAVREALRDLSRSDQLRSNPLLDSRVVRDVTAGPGRPDPDLLRRVVDEAFASLPAHPRTERARRAVERTYLLGALTQEAAAEVLGLAFSTYRRHLAAGVGLLVDRLWDWELYGRPS